MADVTPHLAFPVRFRGTGFVTVEQDAPRHFQDQADVVCRTRPGMHDGMPELGLRDLVARLAPAAPEVIAALSEHVDARFTAEEDESALADRVRTVTLELRQEEGTA
jgi:hypothetical protein